VQFYLGPDNSRSCHPPVTLGDHDTEGMAGLQVNAGLLVADYFSGYRESGGALCQDC
jgi:hypothetical protein